MPLGQRGTAAEATEIPQTQLLETSDVRPWYKRAFTRRPQPFNSSGDGYDVQMQELGAPLELGAVDLQAPLLQQIPEVGEAEA